jgi:hypothetical protein
VKDTANVMHDDRFESRSQVNGFDIRTFVCEEVAVSVAPELGGRIVSIRDLTTDREWIDGWSPVAERRIWRPTNPADFSTGPGSGIDECLPTVLPCHVGGSALADHGELWNRPVALEVDPAERSIFCRWALQSLPLVFSRTITVTENRIRFDYRLQNLAHDRTPFQWAWHPLLTIEEGDVLQFLHNPDTCLDTSGGPLPWPHIQPGCDLSRADLAGIGSQCAKVFLGPMDAPHVQIRSRTGASLGISWPGKWIPYAGIWITRGGWKGLHHWAIEPTNAPMDRLGEAIIRPDLEQLAFLRPREVRTWYVALRVGRGR